jgi:hypothetical protein
VEDFLATRITAFLALGQAVAVAAPPYGSPESYTMPSQYGGARQPAPEVVPTLPPGPRQFLTGPVLNENPQSPAIPLAGPALSHHPLSINLAAALYMSNARPLVIAFAQNSVELAAAQLQRARVMWLPT